MADVARFEDLQNLPTIMDITQEMEVMSALMGMPTDYLAEHVDQFHALIDDLVTSHQGGGYFQLTAENEGAFLRFADWLDPLLARFGAGPMGNSADAFRLTYADLLKAYPRQQLLDADDGSPPAESALEELPPELRMLHHMPRTMPTTVELAVIRALRALAPETLRAHRKLVAEVVETLQTSHASPAGGRGGLTPHNETQFHEFADWLREIAPQLGWPTTKESVFDLTFEQAAKAHPSLRNKATRGPQPGSPVVHQLVERIKDTGPLKILRAATNRGGIWLKGDKWLLTASRGWRITNADHTLAFTWLSPGTQANAAELVGLSIQEAVAQSTVTACDPALRLSDGRWLEIFSSDPLTPWIMQLPNGEFVGAPTAPEWL